MALSLDDLYNISTAIGDVIGYATDNSCGDEECCGGPYYTLDQYQQAADELARYGLIVDLKSLT